MIEECKSYLDMCGIPYITALSESDPQLVGISHYYQNIIEGIYSEDSDMFLYGAETLYKDFDKDEKTFKRLTLKSILNCLQTKTNDICKLYNIPTIKITKQIFVDFSKILGTDYNNGIRKYGGNDREQIFQIFVLSNCNLDKFIENLKQINQVNNEYYIPIDFMEKSELINTYYNDVTIIDPNMFDVKLKEPQINNIKDLLKKNNFRDDITLHISSSLIKFFKIFSNCIKKIYITENYDKKNDNNLDEWVVVQKKRHKNYHI
jgi:5'-3' exonuclease